MITTGSGTFGIIFAILRPNEGFSGCSMVGSSACTSLGLWLLLRGFRVFDTKLQPQAVCMCLMAERGRTK